MMKTKIIFLLTILMYLVTPVLNANTTIEKEVWCKHTNAKGKVVFSGQCLGNWGIVGMGECTKPSDATTRYIIKYTPKSEIWIYYLCDGSAILNGKIENLRGQRKGNDTFYSFAQKIMSCMNFSLLERTSIQLISNTPS